MDLVICMYLSVSEYTGNATLNFLGVIDEQFLSNVCIQSYIVMMGQTPALPRPAQLRYMRNFNRRIHVTSRHHTYSSQSLRQVLSLAR